MKKDTQILKIIASNIKKERKKLNISQEKLSEILGVHRNTIFLLEASKRGLSLVMIENLAQIFNCQPHELLQKNNN